MVPGVEKQKAVSRTLLRASADCHPSYRFGRDFRPGAAPALAQGGI